MQTTTVPTEQLRIVLDNYQKLLGLAEIIECHCFNDQDELGEAGLEDYPRNCSEHRHDDDAFEAVRELTVTGLEGYDCIEGCGPAEHLHGSHYGQEPCCGTHDDCLTDAANIGEQVGLGLHLAFEGDWNRSDIARGLKALGVTVEDARFADAFQAALSELGEASTGRDFTGVAEQWVGVGAAIGEGDVEAYIETELGLEGDEAREAKIDFVEALSAAGADWVQEPEVGA